MQRSQLNQEIRQGADLHHVNAPATTGLRTEGGLQSQGAGVGTATLTRTDVDINMAPSTGLRQSDIRSDSVLRENVTTTREYIKDELVVQQSSETLRQAPIVHEKHIYHEQPMLQERHIYKEIPVVERTVVHEQPSLVTRDVIHELPVQIKQSEVVQENMPVQHEVQKVQHELRVVEDTKLNQQHLHSGQSQLGNEKIVGQQLHGQSNLSGTQLGGEQITTQKTTTTTTATTLGKDNILGKDAKKI